jgi:hypothetical protein
VTEESGSGNRWEPVGAPPPEIPPVAQSAHKAFLRRPCREKAVRTGVAGALLLGGGAVGFTVAQVAESSGEDQPGQQQDVRPVPGSGEFQPPPGSDGRVHDDGGGLDPGHDDDSTISQDET